jgi:Na+/proline symporter
MKREKGPANPERSFGLSVGGVLCAIALILLWRRRVTRAEIIGSIGAVLVVAGWLRPMLLVWPSAIWWRFSRALGYVNARILLTVLFALVLTPIGVFWRLTGKDPLGRRRSRFVGWSTYPARYRDRKHYERMY